MKILVTGGTGFIGLRLVEALESHQDNEIITVSRNPSIKSKNLIICDLSKEQLTEAQMAGVTTVYHLAGYAHDLRNCLRVKR